jgi:hypothetical protein
MPRRENLAHIAKFQPDTDGTHSALQARRLARPTGEVNGSAGRLLAAFSR